MSLVYPATSPTFPSQTQNFLILILVSDLPHLTQLMPSSTERVLELQDFDLEEQPMSVNQNLRTYWQSVKTYLLLHLPDLKVMPAQL
jgi:hypothetical protein